MKQRPILFSAPMVRALPDGSKTQTRRIMKPQPTLITDYAGNPDGTGEYWWACNAVQSMVRIQDAIWTVNLGSICPFGSVGDQLWVRETWRTDDSLDSKAPSTFASWPVKYEADGKVLTHGAFHGNTKGKTRVSIHMPRWASRITLEITGVRVERLQDISEEDAAAEGFTKISKDDGKTWKYGIPDSDGLPGTDDSGWPWRDWEQDPRNAFKKLWEQINGAGSWDANPWVWVLEFKRVEQ